jgi:hypothetical protein
MTAGALLVAVLTILAYEPSARERDGSNAGRAFQRAVGGLGIGSSLRPDWGFGSYDPRIDLADETSMWPVPGGYGYSPEWGMMGDGGVENNGL